MKQFILFSGLILPLFLSAQNIGIGTNTPATLLHVNTGNDLSKGILVSGTAQLGGAVPDLGPGTRLAFFPGKAVFRAGIINGTHWDNVNTGIGSAAFGENTIAKGDYSFATGSTTFATGFLSFASGYFTKATSYISVAFGDVTESGGAASASFGSLTRATGDFATVMGYRNSALASGSLVIGHNCDSILTVPELTQINPLAPLFIVGNGASHVFRSNALVVRRNGDTQIDGNMTVLDGKGLIRSADGTQLKKLSTNVVVNLTLGSGATSTVSFTWPESFSATPEAYVGNVVSGAGGWAETVMTIAELNATGGKLYVHNPRTASFSPNFTIKVIGVGAQ